MSVWDSYEALTGARGTTKHDIVMQREKRYLTTKVPDNLSYFSVTIDGIPQNVAIINSDNLDQKTIISMPGEDVRHGGLVYWMNCYWIINEKDANTNIYAKGKLLQCNYLLKWIDKDGTIREQWCNVEDGTKYLTGDYEDRDFFTTRGDSRIAVTLPRNEHTKNLGRENRFLIDDINNGNEMLSFILSKPLKVGHAYDENNGVYKFVLHEVNSTNDDNFELGIADYYKYYNRYGELLIREEDKPGTLINEDTGKTRWL